LSIYNFFKIAIQLESRLYNTEEVWQYSQGETISQAEV
jgi:hypothetical protein